MVNEPLYFGKIPVWKLMEILDFVKICFLSIHVPVTKIISADKSFKKCSASIEL